HPRTKAHRGGIDARRQIGAEDRHLLIADAGPEPARRDTGDGGTGADASERHVNAYLVISAAEPASGHLLPARLDEDHLAPCLVSGAVPRRAPRLHRLRGLARPPAPLVARIHGRAPL